MSYMDADYWGSRAVPFGQPVDALRAALRSFPAIANVLSVPDAIYSERNKLAIIASTFRGLFLSFASVVVDKNYFGDSGLGSHNASIHLWHSMRDDPGNQWVSLTDPAYFAVKSASIAAWLLEGKREPSWWPTAINFAAKATSPSIVAVGLATDMLFAENVRRKSIIEMPLWDEAPASWKPLLLQLNETLRDLGDPWQMVSDWYECMCQGRKPFALDRKTTDQLLYQRVGWLENDDLFLSRLALALSSPVPAPSAKLAEYPTEVLNKIWQRPAPFRFSWSPSGPIDVDFRALRIPNAEFANTIFMDVKSKAAELSAIVENRNSVTDELKRSIKDLVEQLNVPLRQVNAGRLRSRFRSLEAHALPDAYGDPSEAMDVDVVARLREVFGLVIDLQACFPEIAAIEKEAARIRFSAADEDAEQLLSVITETARELSSNAPHLVTKDASDALRSLGNDVRHAPRAVKGHLIATWAVTTHNFLAASLWKVLGPVGTELLNVSASTYTATKDGVLNGVKDVAKAAPQIALGYAIGGPTLAAAAMFSSFNSLKEAKEAVDKKIETDLARVPPKNIP